MSTPGNTNEPRNFPAQELLAAIKALQADLAATRASLGRGGGAVGTSGEVTRTAQAEGEESAARQKNIELALRELEIQKQITAQARAAADATLGQVAAGEAAAASAYRPVTSSGQRLAAQVSAAGPSRAPIALLGTAEANAAAREAQMRAEAATAASAAPPKAAGMGAVAQSATQAEAASKSYWSSMREGTAVAEQYAAATGTGSAANANFIASLARGEASLGQIGMQLALTAGKFAQWTTGIALVYAGLGVFNEIYKGAKDSSSGVSQLQRSIDHLDPTKAQAAFRDLAAQVNVPIKEASDAVFGMSRTFGNLPAAVAAAGVVLRAQKVDNVDLATSVRALTAVHQQFGVSAQGLSGVFDIADEAQRRFNARVTDSIQVLAKASAAWKDAGGDLTSLQQFSAYAERVTQLPGNQIGTALYRAASNTLANPTNQAQIAALGLDPKLAETNIGEFFDQAIRAAKGKSGAWQRELAIAIGGKQQGGRVILPILAAGDLNLWNQMQTSLTPQNAAGSTQRELNDILNQTDERLKAIINDLQQFGSALNQSGALAPFGAMLFTLDNTLSTARNVVDEFDKLPESLRTAISLAGELGAAIAFLKFTGAGQSIGGRLPGAAGGFFRPSAAEVAAQQEAGFLGTRLTSLQGAKAGTANQIAVAQEQQAVNEAAAAEATTVEQRATILQENATLEQKIERLNLDLLGIERVEADLRAERAAVLSGSVAAGTASNEAAAAGIAGGAGGRGFKNLLGKGMSAMFAGFMADVATQTAANMLQSIGAHGAASAVNRLSGVAVGAGAGFALGGPVGAVAGAGLGLDATLGQRLGANLAGLTGSRNVAPGSSAGFQDAYGKLFEGLVGEIGKAGRGKLDASNLAQLQQTLKNLATDPAYAQFRSSIEGLQISLDKATQSAAATKAAIDPATGPTMFGQIPGVTGVGAKDLQKRIDTLSDRETTFGASGSDLKRNAQYVVGAAEQYGTGADNQDGMRTLKDAEDKLVSAVSKNAKDLADAASTTTDPRRQRALYQQAIQSVQRSMRAQDQELGRQATDINDMRAERDGLEQSGRAFDPGTGRQVGNVNQPQIDALNKQIANNLKTYRAAKAAVTFTTNQLRLLLQQERQQAFNQESSTIDSTLSVENASTQDKAAQLANTLRADNQKLALAAQLFTKNSNEYRKALAAALKDQQDIANEAITTLQSQSALAQSQVGGMGADRGIGQERVSVSFLQQELAKLRASHADPNTIRDTLAKLNDAEYQLRQDINNRAKTVNDALNTIRNAQTGDTVQQARNDYRTAVADEAGLSGVDLLTAKATAAQRKQALQRAVLAQDQDNLKTEHDLQQITDNQYITGLQALLRNKQLSQQERNSIRQEIFNLENQGSSSLELNVGQIKLPSIYQIRRAIAGSGGPTSFGDTTVNSTANITVNVRNARDVGHVAHAIDRHLKTTVHAAARAKGLI